MNTSSFLAEWLAFGPRAFCDAAPFLAWLEVQFPFFAQALRTRH